MRNPYHNARHVDAVYSVDRWTSALWNSRKETSPKIGSAMRSMEDAMFDASASVADRSREAQRTRKLANAFGREVFARLYGEPEALDAPAAGTEMVQQVHEALSNLSEFDALKQQVAGDPDLAALATADFVSAMAQQVERIEDRKRKAQQTPQTPQDRRAARRAQRAQRKQDPAQEIRRAARAAVTKVADKAAETQAAMNGLLPGVGHRPALHEQQDTARCQLAEKVSKSKRLKKIMKMAGRFRRLAESEKAKSDNGCEAIVGVTVGGDLPRVIPSELANLRHPTLRKLALAKLADRRMFQYRLTGQTPQGRGPVVAMIDVSGSMNLHDRHLWASAITLACLGVAVKEKRAFTAIFFNDGIASCYQLSKTDVATEIDYADPDRILGPIGSSVDLAMKVATVKSRGGTDFNKVFAYALKLKSAVKQDRSDLILVTDGHADVSKDLIADVQEARQNGTRIFGLTVGGGSLGKAVNQICDHVVDLDSAIQSDNADAIVGAIP